MTTINLNLPQDVSFKVVHNVLKPKRQVCNAGKKGEIKDGLDKIRE